ncbi:MAG: DUF2061 domain-containing protein [Cohaesibacter sp.]|nr:DUF2061 domain-containing protein [Cohaesibacter sp.]MCV6601358.1 DUF2061 domain-containing protein [Cohaesibacter sp.]
MDTALRLLAKSITWQVLGLVSMTLVGYLFTGSFTAGGGIALVGSGVGFCCYFLHETLWSKISWGRFSDDQSASIKPSSRA